MGTNYRDEAQLDAVNTVDEFIDHIVEKLVDAGKASDDLLNNYPNGDSYHHENHVDKAYNLQEAAELLDELNKFEETDEGLWEGLPPRDAICAQAAYTYGNAVYSMWSDLIDEINDDGDIEELIAQKDEVESLDEDEENFSEQLVSLMGEEYSKDTTTDRALASIKNAVLDRVKDIIKENS